MTQVKTPGESISVLIQVAELAQSRGILSFEDAVITKAAIDLLKNLAKPTYEDSLTEETN